MIDHRICNLCRKTIYKDRYPDDKTLAEPILRNDTSQWYCPATGKRAYLVEDPPEDCIYILEQLMYSQRSWKMKLKEWVIDGLGDLGFCDKRFPLR